MDLCNDTSATDAFTFCKDFEVDTEENRHSAAKAAGRAVSPGSFCWGSRQWGLTRGWARVPTFHHMQNSGHGQSETPLLELGPIFQFQELQL